MMGAIVLPLRALILLTKSPRPQHWNPLPSSIGIRIACICLDQLPRLQLILTAEESAQVDQICSLSDIKSAICAYSLYMNHDLFVLKPYDFDELFYPICMDLLIAPFDSFITLLA